MLLSRKVHLELFGYEYLQQKLDLDMFEPTKVSVDNQGGLTVSQKMFSNGNRNTKIPSIIFFETKFEMGPLHCHIFLPS